MSDPRTSDPDLPNELIPGAVVREGHQSFTYGGRVESFPDGFTDWNLKADLVTIVTGFGGPLEAMVIADRLRQRGQRRMVILDAAGQRSEDIVRVWEQQLNEMPLPTAGAHAIFRLPGAPDLQDLLTDAFVAQSRDRILSMNAIRTFGRDWVRNSILNLLDLPRWPTVDDLIFRGQPAVIIAPGPSLEKNARQVAALKGRAILITVAQALPICRTLGIDPDFAMMLDAADQTLFLEGSRTPLILGNDVFPAHFRTGVPVVTFALDNAIGAWCYQALPAPPTLVAGGSVTTSAFALALLWGCNPIVMAGLDLSYGPAGKLYACRSVRVREGAAGMGVAEGWDAREHGIIPEDRYRRVSLVSLPGYYGGRVQSDVQFSAFREWFINICKGRRVGQRLVNATEGGVYIPGMEHVPVASIAALLDAPVDAVEVLARAQARDRSTWRWAIDVQRETAIEDLREIVARAEAGDFDGATAAFRRVPFVELIRLKEFVDMLTYKDTPAFLRLLADCARETLGFFSEAEEARL
ncbi:MAG: DUF115 domain-containing protein [Dehalococcoidia bacterium]|nr:DUF115 domain-containing protein [Dehalococcoidia bacterium]